MSILEQVASGAVEALGNDSGKLISEALSKGQTLVSSTSDPALKASLQAALDVISTPDAQETLATVAAHELVAVTSYVGLQLGESARVKFLSDPSTTFSQRHAMLASDDAATRQSAQDHAALVSDLEALGGSILKAAGGAAVPFLMAIF